MANYHLEVTVISRRKGSSLAGAVHYITGERLRDNYRRRTYYGNRDDVLYWKIFQPRGAPPGFDNLQHLCNCMDGAETRRDARTARMFKGSLPNELPLSEQKRIVRAFIDNNFVKHGLCAIAAIHEGRNKDSPEKNNPHVHIIVSTRTVGPDGFSKKKDREHDKREYIEIWREQWALCQNRAYERNRMDVRVSHKSLEVQGIDREPVKYLSRIDWQKEKRGERTHAGDERRAIEERNRERSQQNERAHGRYREHSR